MKRHGAQIMENKAMRKLVKVRSEEILLIEHRRAHNICIELAGVRMPFPAIKVRVSLALIMSDNVQTLKARSFLFRTECSCLSACTRSQSFRAPPDSWPLRHNLAAGSISMAQHLLHS